MSESKQKLFVLDTNVLVHDPQSIFVLAGADNRVAIPIIVLAELDHLKRDESTRVAAQDAAKVLESLSTSGNISKGVTTSNGGVVTVDMDGKPPKGLPFGMDPKKPDNIIVATALRYQSIAHERYVTVLVTKDINLRTLARSLGITAEDYKSDKVVRVDQLYSGFRELIIPDEEIARFYPAGLHEGKEVCIPADEILGGKKALPNSCWRLRGGILGKTVLAVYKSQDKIFRLVHKPLQKAPKRGICPRNEEQAFAFALGMDESIPIVTLAGPAGTGKSIMSLLAAWRIVIKKRSEGSRSFHRKVIEEADASNFGLSRTPERIQVYTPTRELGPELGFLPGDLEEKISPWKRPTISNLRMIADDEDNLHKLLNAGTIEILPITHLRGDTVNQAVMIVRDAQNFTPAEMKAIVTRVGQGTKLFVEGDLDQVDVPHLDPQSSGLAHLISKFPGQESYGHIKLIKGERSEVATLASALL